MRIIVDWLIDQRLYVLLMLGSMFGYFWLAECKTKIKINEWQAMLLSVLNTVFGVLFVKFFAFLEGAPGGMSVFGGIFFMPIPYFLGAKLTKRNMASVFDIFAVCTVFTIMCSRINCLIGGCCGGIVIPWTDNLRWPTQMAEIIFHLILVVVLCKKCNVREYRGKIYPIYLMAYGIFRFLVEFVREKEIQRLFHLSHLWAVIAFAVGLYFFRRPSRKEKDIHRRKECKHKREKLEV